VQVLAYSGGAWRQSGELAPEAARDLAWGPTLVWIRLEGLAEGRLESLASVFNLHPLAIEDVRNHRQRPKVEDYENLTFVVARAPRWNEAEGELSWLTVGIFLGPDFIITACTDHVAELDAVEKRLTAGPGTKQANVDQVFYHVLDSIVDAYFPIMDNLEDRIEALEEGVVDGAERQELERIRDFKRMVSRARKTIYPMREAMVSIERGDHPNVRRPTRLYLRDVADHTTRLAERLEHVNELAVLTQETWNATLANQTNRIVKFLTGITFVLTIPMLVWTLFGINSPGQPNIPWWSVTVGAIALTVPAWLFARRKDWL
jgi:magnesium transporter